MRWLWITLAACGSSYDVQDYWTELGTMHCTRMRDCCTDPELTDFLTPDGTGTAENCETTFQTVEHADIITNAIARKTIVFDASRAHACVAALETLACPGYKPAVRYREAFCDDPLVPTVADGGACFVDAECVTDNCQGADLRAMPMVPGGCRAPTPDGGTCGIGTANCANPTDCQAGGVCALGAAAGSPCSADYQCADGWCKGNGSSSEGRCIHACDGQ